MRRIAFIWLASRSLIVAGISACQLSPSQPTSLPHPITTLIPEPTIEPALAEPTPELFVLPLSAYILDDDAGILSSAREVEEVAGILQLVNDIWSQADIMFEVQVVERMEMPASHLEAISRAQFDPFFAGIGGDFQIESPALINAFYAQQIGGANGINPFGARVFFVMDTPSVHDERVTSHEIGHILGLSHVRDDRNSLMFSGTNGMNLSAEEIAVARYNARILLEQAGLR